MDNSFLTTTVSPLLGVGPFPTRKSCIHFVYGIKHMPKLWVLAYVHMKGDFRNIYYPLGYLILKTRFCFYVVWIPHFRLAIILPPNCWHCIFRNKAKSKSSKLLCVSFLIADSQQFYIALSSTPQGYRFDTKTAEREKKVIVNLCNSITNLRAKHFA